MPRKNRIESRTGIYHWINRGITKKDIFHKDTYPLECGRYIERNPVKAGLKEYPESYEYSSYRYYALGEANSLLTPSPAYLSLSDIPNERQFMYHKYVTEPRIQEVLENRGKIPF